MKEIEVKILEVDVESLSQKILGWGAEKVFEGPIYTLHFSKGSELVNKVLRLRKKGNETYICFKERISSESAKVMDEYETRVDDFDVMRSILEKMGYEVNNSLKKNRVTYQLEDVLFEFDTIPGIPTFLEIEAPSVDLLRRYVERLGYTMDCARSWSTGDLLEHYGKK